MSASAAPRRLLPTGFQIPEPSEGEKYRNPLLMDKWSSSAEVLKVYADLGWRHLKEGKPSEDTEKNQSSTPEPWLNRQVREVLERSGQNGWEDYWEEQREAAREGGWNVDGEGDRWGEEAEQVIEDWLEPEPESKPEETFWGQGERYNPFGDNPLTPTSAYLWERWNAQAGAPAEEEISRPSWSENLLFLIRRAAGEFVEGIVDVFINGSE
ncbi:hypothetical protein FS749_002937 [Ceratobasidium sp. UAMH 11750]|nr:hypothetical protein FS749_002937 [Ceratobasidium sp. UAMH 11750]